MLNPDFFPVLWTRMKPPARVLMVDIQDKDFHAGYRGIVKKALEVTLTPAGMVLLDEIRVKLQMPSFKEFAAYARHQELNRQLNEQGKLDARPSHSQARSQSAS